MAAGATDENAHTGTPIAETAALARDPRPGENSTSPSAPWTTAAERCTKRPRRGTARDPPASQDTRAPAPSAKTTVETADREQDPAPSEANAA